MPMNINEKEFFDVFTYDHMATDYCDRTIVFEHNCEIIKDIYTPTGTIRIGQLFDQVNWYLDKMVFQFIIWELRTSGCYEPNKNSVEINQIDLAKLMDYNDGKTTQSFPINRKRK